MWLVSCSSATASASPNSTPSSTVRKSIDDRLTRYVRCDHYELTSLLPRWARCPRHVRDRHRDHVVGDEEAFGSDPFDRDTDNDGLEDATDRSNGCSPTSYDTDGDGFSDGSEVNAGTNCAVAN